MDKTPWYDFAFIWRRTLPTQSVQSSLFWLRIMDSDLEVTILIPLILHLAANDSSDIWQSRHNDANRTTFTANSRNRILRSPNRTLPNPWLHQFCPKKFWTESVTVDNTGGLTHLEEFWITASYTNQTCIFCVETEWPVAADLIFILAERPQQGTCFPPFFFKGSLVI